MKSLMTATALVALLAGAPALAQDPAPTPPAAGDTQPAPAPVTPDVTAPTPGGDQAATTEQQPTFLDQQQDSQLLASQMIGATIYDSAGNNLGSVKDIVMNQDGQAEAVVIGVGGFLGIGQKTVAASMGQVEKSTDENGNLKLTLNVSAGDLDAAPDFKTLDDIKREQQAQQPASPDAGGGMAPSPAPAQ